MRPLDRKRVDAPAGSNPSAERQPSARQPREKPGVLVADDDHLVRVMVQLGLERDGFDVWLAADGREAVDLYGKHREAIAVVLLDVRMPGLDGPQTLDALRQLNPHVRACFMSGDLGGYDPEELRRRGAVHLLTKPFLLDELVKLLRRWTKGASADPLPSGGHAGSEPGGN